MRVPVPPGPLTWTGVDESVVVLLPSWPLLLSPQHHTVPSVLTAQVCSVPAAALATVVRVPVPPGPLTWTGVDAVGGGVVAELAFVVEAPAPGGAVGFDRARVLQAGGDLGDGGEGSGSAWSFDLDGGGASRWWCCRRVGLCC